MSRVDNILHESPSQTAGPYVHIGCTPIFSGIDGVYSADPGRCMSNDKTIGQRITLTGCVFDGTGALVSDALIEIWQADASGLYPSCAQNHGESDPNFNGWGRSPVEMETGEFVFETIKPGSVPYTDGRMQAPHISLWIVARGINIGLHTRLYFEDEAAANNADPILSAIQARERVDTLIAKAEGNGIFRFDIHLQGPGETVFFDI